MISLFSKKRATTIKTKLKDMVNFQLKVRDDFLVINIYGSKL